jgi:transcription initiation factor TFIID subunit 13
MASSSSNSANSSGGVVAGSGGSSSGSNGSVSGNSGDAANSSKFRKDLEEMMFGFGDGWPPNKDSVALVEILVKQYIEDICLEAKELARLKGGAGAKLDVESFLFLVRKEPRKYNRLVQLLTANEELKKAKSLTEIHQEFPKQVDENS